MDLDVFPSMLPLGAVLTVFLEHHHIGPFLWDRWVVVCLVGSFVHWEADGLLLAFLVDEGESDVNESHGFNLLNWLGVEAMRLPFRY